MQCLHFDCVQQSFYDNNLFNTFFYFDFIFSEAPLIQSDEAPLFIGYLALEGSGQDGCLNQAACQSPDVAQQYLKAAMAVIKGTEMFDKDYFNSTTNYSYTLNQLEHAINRGIEGAPCDIIYHCHL